MSLSSKVNYSLEALSGITVGNINITGNIFQNNNPYIASQWTSTSGNALTYTSGNVIISGGSLLVSSLTTGNINFTGSLSQNGSPYIGSQWIGTSGSIYYGTSGSSQVGINTTAPGATLDVSGTGRITTSLTTGSVFSTNQTSTNIVGTRISAANFVGTTLSTANIYASLGTISNFVATSSTITNLNVPGTLTVVNITSTNLVDTTISAGTLIATSVSTANLSALNGTITNMVVSSNTISNSFVSGGLGIGAVNPNTSYKLDVAGSIRSGLRIDIGGTQPIYNGNTLGRLFITGAQNSVTSGPNIVITTAQDAFPTYNFLTYGHDSAWTMYDMYFDGSSFRNSSSATAFMMVKENSTLKWNYNTSGFSAGAAAPVSTSICIGSGGNIGLGGQITPIYTLDVSGGARIVTGITAGSSTFTSVSAGDSQFTGLSAGNINFTGNLFQNGSAYIGSQWVGTSGSIYYGTVGSSLVGINTTSPAFTLDVTGSGDFSTFVTSGALYSTNQTSTNIVANSLSSGTLVGTTLSTANIYGSLGTITNMVHTNLSSGTLSGTSATVINLINTNTTTSNIKLNDNSAITIDAAADSRLALVKKSGTAFGAIATNNVTDMYFQASNSVIAGNPSANTYTTLMSLSTRGNLTITGTTNTVALSTGTLYSTNQTSNNIVATTSLSTGTLVGTTTSTANIYASLGTISNFVGTNISSSTYSGTSGTIGNFVATTSLSTGTFVGTTTSTANIYASLGTVSNFVATASTITNLSVPGTLTVVNITSTNLVETNMTAATILVTGGALNATFNSNTIGNIITTGGNVGIGTNAPTSLLHLKNAGSITLLIEADSDNVNENDNPTIRLTQDNGETGVNIGLNANNATYIDFNKGSFTSGTSFLISDNDTPRLVVSSSGNVGIGTTVAGSSLHVAGYIPYIPLGNGVHMGLDPLNSSTIQLNAGGSTTGSTVIDMGYSGVTYKSRIVHTNSTNILGFRVNGNTYDSLSISSTGNVGIGTTSPAFTLDVNGTIDAITYTGANLAITSATAGTMIANDSLSIGGISSFFTGSFSANNNVASASNVTGLLFPSASVRSFLATLTINLTKSGGNLNEMVTLEGIQRDSGWVLFDTSLGEDTGLVFTIDSTGQIQYTSLNYTGWVSTTVRFEGHYYTLAGTYTPTALPTSGSVSITGDLSISSTKDATNTSSGALIIAGGAGISKSLLVGQNLNVGGLSNTFTGSFAAANNVAVATNVSGFLVPTATFSSFTASVNVRLITTTTTLNAQYLFEATQTTSGWLLNDTTLGDNVDLTFTITSLGQIQYTSTNVANWQSNTINYSVTAISISSGFTAVLPTSGNVTISGNLTIDSTTDSSSTSSASLVLAGGVGINKSLLLGGNFNIGGVTTQFAGTFIAANSATGATFPALLFPNATIRSFTCTISVRVVSTINYNTQHTIEGIQTATDGWQISDSQIGDSSGITFAINSSGQITYTSPTFTSWTSTTMHYNAVAYNISSSYTPIPMPTGGSSSVAGSLVIQGTDPASSTSSGSLSVSGGVNIQKNLIVTDGITASTLLLTSNINISNSSNNYSATSGGFGLTNDVVMSANQLYFTASGAATPTLNSRGVGSKIVLYPTIGANTGDYSIGIESSNMWLQVPTINTGYKFYQGTTSSMVISSSGNVGIGTISPASKLHVYGTANTYGHLLIDDPGSTIWGAAVTGGGSAATLTLKAGYSATGETDSQRSKFQINAWNSDANIVNSFVFKTSGDIERMRIINSGNVGIGTSSPGYTLDVAGIIRGINGTTSSVIINGDATWGQIEMYGINGTYIDFKNNSGDDYDARIQNLGSNNSLNFHMNAAANIGMSLTSAGTLLISGDIGAFASISDRRLKTNVTDISPESALETVKTLRPVTFNWKDDIFNQARRGEFDSGFIAQEVEEVIPHAVGEYTTIDYQNTYKNMRHERIIPYLVGSIQKLEKIITTLNNRIEFLESRD